MARLKPDIVLMDVNMPTMDGIEAARKLAETYPDVGIIMLTMFTGEEHLRQARRAGASAYVLKDAPSPLLLQTVRDVALGDMPLLHDSRPTTDNLAEAPPHSTASPQPAPASLLSSNERSILSLLANGLTNDNIARQTGMPDLMVRTYLEEIYRKLGLSGRDAALRYAREQGLADDGRRTTDDGSNE